MQQACPDRLRRGSPPGVVYPPFEYRENLRVVGTRSTVPLSCRDFAPPRGYWINSRRTDLEDCAENAVFLRVSAVQKFGGSSCCL